MRPYPLVQIVSRLSSLCLAFLLLGAPIGLAQIPSSRATRLTPGTPVRVTLQRGPAFAGQVLQSTDSTLVLSSETIPLELLQQQSLPLRVSYAVVVIRWADGTRTAGQVIGLTERAVVFQKLGGIGVATRDRRAVVTVSRPGRTPTEVEVVLRWEEIGTVQDILRSIKSTPGAGDRPHQLALVLTPGVRVRLNAPILGGKSLIGTVVSVDTAGTIVVQPSNGVSTDRESSPLSVPWATVKHLDLSEGIHSSGSDGAAGAIVGLMGGVLAGALLGTAVVAGSDDPEAGFAFIGTLPLGAAAGLVIGAIVGARPREHWQAVPVSRIRLTLGAPARDRFASKPEGMALNVSVRF